MQRFSLNKKNYIGRLGLFALLISIVSLIILYEQSNSLYYPSTTYQIFRYFLLLISIAISVAIYRKIDPYFAEKLYLWRFPLLIFAIVAFLSMIFIDKVMFGLSLADPRLEGPIILILTTTICLIFLDHNNYKSEPLFYILCAIFYILPSIAIILFIVLAGNTYLDKPILLTSTEQLNINFTQNNEINNLYKKTNGIVLVNVSNDRVMVKSGV